MINNPTITVSISFPIQGEKFYCSKQIGEDIYRHVFRSIDYPSHDANGIERIFCSTPHEINSIEINRKRLAESISKEITEMLMKSMSQNDTIMGYKKS